ncbi:phospholipase D-like domain-containing protein [Curtobacterium flaccumfaciens]|uniref:phospholipase D-like domain-containing protein n=1 Tax=Curtobacterium flaccumfaciens TaxID=2035 RepID=UPI003F804957
MPHADLRAADISDTWRDRVTAATSTVMVFTPYFDDLIVDILASSSLHAYQKTVVTDLSPRSGNQQYRRQLEACRALLEADIEVVSFDRLHAKVLIVDAEPVTVGSQNFTRYATSSKETTAVTAEPDPAFIDELNSWYEAATKVTSELIDTLIDALDETLTAVEEANAALEEAFDDAWAEHVAAVERQKRNRSAAARDRVRREAAVAQFRATVARQALADVRGRIEPLTPSDPWDGRETFRIGDRAGDFTQWRVRDSDGDDGTHIVQLLAKRMYPVVRLDNLCLTFTRAVKTQLSYARFGVNLDGLRFGDHPMDVSVTMPRDATIAGNLTLAIRPAGWPGRERVTAHFLFDGEDAALVATEMPAAPRLRWPSAVRDRLDDVAAVTALVGTSLTPFKFRTLDKDRVNAEEFFPSVGLVRLVEFHGRPVLAVEP